MTNHPRIVMDERERGALRTALARLPCDIQIETLPIADFVISPTCGIERKRGDDLTASLCDSRFFSQLYALKTAYSQPLLLLEEPFRMFTREGVLDASLFGALVYAVYKLGIALIPTRNIAETAQILWSLAKRAQAKSPFTYVAASKDLPLTRADQTYFLEGLIDSGPTRADQLLTVFQTPKAVIDLLCSSPVVSTEDSPIPFHSVSPMRIKGLGSQFFHKNRFLFQNPFEEAYKIPKS